MRTLRWAVAALVTVGLAAVPAAVHASSVPNQPSLAGKFVPVSPHRLLDTRDGGGPLGPGSSLPLDVSGVTGDPSVVPTAVVLNVTVTNPTADSFVAVNGAGDAPATSNINYRAGQTVPNLVTVQLHSDSTVFFFTHTGTVDVIADVFGYYTVDRAGGSFSTLSPTRLLDTRDGIGGISPGGTLPLQVTGRNSVPPSGVTAVQLNVTVTNPSASSFLSVFPSGAARPNVSNLNFTAGATIANSVIVPVGPDGKIDLYNNVGWVDVVVDISGYYTGNPPGTVPQGGVYRTTDAPTRLLDTRDDGGPLGAGQSRALTVPNKATAVVLNVTVTNPTGNSFVTAYPGGTPVPTSSSIDFTTGQTLSNLVVVPVGADGTVAFFNHIGNVDLVVDMFGYFQAGADLSIESLGFAQSTVAGGGTVDLNWTVTNRNANAGSVAGEVVLRRDNHVGQPIVVSFGLGSAVFVSGDVHRSSYTYHFTAPGQSDSTATKWVVALVDLRDDQGNQLLASGDDLTAAVTANTTVGTAGPTYDNLAAQSPFLYAGSTNSAVYTFDVTDFWRGTITLTGPSGQTLSRSFDQSSVDGDEVSELCPGLQCSIPVLFPKGTANGKWVVSKLSLTSDAGFVADYNNLNAAPITVTDNSSLQATSFSVNPVNNWRGDVDTSISMRVNGARQGISAIYVEPAFDAYCSAPTTTPTLNPDGSYSVAVHVTKGVNSCGINGIVVVDGSGNAAVYGSRHNAPDPGLVITQVRDTTPPSVTSASVSAPANGSVTITAHTAIGIADITTYHAGIFDNSGLLVGQGTGATSQAADGTVAMSATIDVVPPGVYTVGFSLTDDGSLTTAYGPPNGKAMPGGPLTITVS
ncbi:hypothetical protein [Kutzneria sp. CA-103260]|uniref:hypothetical protein n=1 Tax=Kutzneria sp. CA-103260 TaxID=2802641 RepID=UPI001BA6FD00|nr:hypothetical protein [Kutzneria sp. CA-103260]QUQ62642.1 hypothetical protein JJ691_03540 [Kutzneria sp. CA-103260]